MKRLYTTFCLLMLAQIALAAGGEVRLTLSSGIPIASDRYGDERAAVLVLWLTGEHGRLEEEHRAAARMAASGIEVWLTDWFAPYFLPQLASSVSRVPDADLADWLERVRRQHAGKPLVLVASGHTSALALRAAAAWKARFDTPSPLAGAILLWPLLYQDPLPGEEPAYDPVVSRTRLDLALVFPQASAGYWWRETLKAAFEAAGSRVRITVLPGLRDRFYHRDDANARERSESARLGDILSRHVRMLAEATLP